LCAGGVWGKGGKLTNDAQAKNALQWSNVVINVRYKGASKKLESKKEQRGSGEGEDW